jgi:hypothetical protein
MEFGGLKYDAFILSSNAGRVLVRIALRHFISALKGGRAIINPINPPRTANSGICGGREFSD